MGNPKTDQGLSVETTNDPVQPAMSPWGETEIVLKAKKGNKSVTVKVVVDEGKKTATATVTSVHL